MRRRCVDDTRIAGEVIQAVASKKTRTIRLLCVLLLLTFAAIACSTDTASEPTTTAPDSTPAESSDSNEEQDEQVETTTDPGPTAVPEPVLGDENLASVTNLRVGEQVQDAQGNLIAIYGIAEWPATFAALSDTSQTGFPFFGDVQAVADPSAQLVVLDVGMCAAGLDVNGFGTAEFFVHQSATEMLSTEPVLNRGVLTRHPVVRPGFGFPSPAECERGFLPVLWGGDSPGIARYVLATRASASADIERHVYQWDLDVVDIAALDQAEVVDAADPDDVQFAAGQTVTFNQGRLEATTIEVDGWAELVGAESPIEGTRKVAVSVEYCPASDRLPEFGLGVDGWNIVAPIGDVSLGADQNEDPTTTCFDGWLEFAIPFGSVPTGFFASDGANADTGYAEWSLLGAAVPAPQS